MQTIGPGTPPKAKHARLVAKARRRARLRGRRQRAEQSSGTRRDAHHGETIRDVLAHRPRVRVAHLLAAGGANRRRHAHDLRPRSRVSRTYSRLAARIDAGTRTISARDRASARVHTQQRLKEVGPFDERLEGRTARKVEGGVRAYRANSHTGRCDGQTCPYQIRCVRVCLGGTQISVRTACAKRVGYACRSA